MTPTIYSDPEGNWMMGAWERRQGQPEQPDLSSWEVRGSALERIANWCRQYWHGPVREQWTALKQKAVGALCLFRYNRKFQSAPRVPATGHRHVAEVAPKAVRRSLLAHHPVLA
jgi:hypothetical protein